MMLSLTQLLAKAGEGSQRTFRGKAREIVVKGRDARARVIAALSKAFPGKPWDQCNGQIVVEGRDAYFRTLEALSIAKGEGPGHPFRGNQYTTGSSAPATTIPDRAQQTEAIGYLKNHSKLVSDMVGGKGLDAILDKHGQGYYFDDKSFLGNKATRHRCFELAAQGAADDPTKTYIEGYVAVHGVPIHHAWLADEHNRVIDPTIESHDGKVAYFGVPIKRQYLMDTLQRTKRYGVFDWRNQQAYTDDPNTYLAKEFDETKHPRAPKGSPEGAGGKFVSSQSPLYTTGGVAEASAASLGLPRPSHKLFPTIEQAVVTMDYMTLLGEGKVKPAVAMVLDTKSSPNKSFDYWYGITGTGALQYAGEHHPDKTKIVAAFAGVVPADTMGDAGGKFINYGQINLSQWPYSPKSQSMLNEGEAAAIQQLKHTWANKDVAALKAYLPPTPYQQHDTFEHADTAVKGAIKEGGPDWKAAVAIDPVWLGKDKSPTQYFMGSDLFEASKNATDAGWHAGNLSNVAVGVIPAWGDSSMFVDYGSMSASVAVDQFPSKGKSPALPKLQDAPQHSKESGLLEDVTYLAKPTNVPEPIPLKPTPEKELTPSNYIRDIEGAGRAYNMSPTVKLTTVVGHTTYHSSPTVTGAFYDAQTKSKSGYLMVSDIAELQLGVSKGDPANTFIPLGTANRDLVAQHFHFQNPNPKNHITSLRELTPDESYAINSYANGSYTGINKYLAGTYDYEASDTAAKIEKRISQIDDALDTSHVNKEITILRGAKVKHIPKGLQVGSSFVNPAYTSTSTRRSTASSFDRGVMMEITVPVGTRAVVASESESEIVLPRNGRFTVTGIISGDKPRYKLRFEDTKDYEFYHPAKIRDMTVVAPTSQPPKPKTANRYTLYKPFGKAFNPDTGGDLERFVWSEAELFAMLEAAGLSTLAKGEGPGHPFRGNQYTDMPAEPGTVSIPEGHVRLYHQTGEENLEHIRQHGLELARARGIEGPKAIYADERGFYGKPSERPTVEFSVPKERWDAPFVRADSALDQSRVAPENIIGIHYPWHARARYIENNPEVKAEVLSGGHDDLLNERDYGPAIRYIKQKYLAKYDESQHPRDEHGRWTDDDKQELITGAAIKLDGVVYPGWDHAHALERAAHRLNVSFDSLADRVGDMADKNAESGFITSAGRFLDRQAALTVARQAKQVDERPEAGGRARALDTAYLNNAGWAAFAKWMPHAYIGKYDPNQPRDKDGKWTDGPGIQRMDDNTYLVTVNPRASRAFATGQVVMTEDQVRRYRDWLQTGGDIRAKLPDVHPINRRVLTQTHQYKWKGNEASIDELGGINDLGAQRISRSMLAVHANRDLGFMRLHIPRGAVLTAAQLSTIRNLAEQFDRVQIDSGGSAMPLIELPNRNKGQHLERALRFDYLIKFREDQARDDHGRWTEEGRGGGPLGHGYSDKAFELAGKIYTSDVYDAVRALYENKQVVLSQPKQVTVLLDKLHDVSKKWTKLGGKAPVFNLCNVTIRGTNLFCADTQGIPRVKMPQVKDPTALIQYLHAKGVKITHGTELAANLRPTQSELNGASVAALVTKLKSGQFKSDLHPMLISKDDYVLDGHHRWAAKVAAAAGKNELKTMQLPVTRVDIGITELLEDAKRFSTSARDITHHRWMEKRLYDLLAKAFNPDQPRDYHGRWTDMGAPSEGGEWKDWPNADTVPDTPEFGKHSVQVHKRGQEIAKALGFDPGLVGVDNRRVPFELNGQRYNYAGSYSPNNKHVTLYPQEINDLNIEGITAHEIQHARFDQMRTDAALESKAMLDAIRAEFPNPSPTKDPMMADGTLRLGWEKQYPVYQAWTKIMNRQAELEATDGVSDYSRKWWDAVTDKKATPIQAIDETLAEIARQDYANKVWADNFPETKRSRYEGIGHVYTKKNGFKGIKPLAPLWKSFYEMVNKHWRRYHWDKDKQNLVPRTKKLTVTNTSKDKREAA